MGLIKQIEMPNGVMFNYHRVSTLSIATNNRNIVQVSSYISAAKRQEEVEHIARLSAGDNESSCNVLVETAHFSSPYDPSMTIESAYAYLLTLPEFEGAEMEDTEYMLDAIETVPEIEAELAGQQQADIQQSQEGDVE